MSNSFETGKHDPRSQGANTSAAPVINPSVGTLGHTSEGSGNVNSNEFMNAHSQSRSGNPYGSTQHGSLGTGSESRFGQDRMSNTPAMSAIPGKVPASGCTLMWPDAQGGGLGHSKE